MGYVDQPRSPALAGPLGSVEKLLEIVSDEQRLHTFLGLLREHILKTIQKGIRLHRKGRHPAAEGRVAEQHLDQMLHIQLGMAPATGDVLTRQKQLPGVIAEAVGFLGEAAPDRGGFTHRGHSDQAAEREESSINSTL